MGIENLPPRLRPKQVAENFGISLPTVWRYVRLGKIKAIRPTKGVTLFDTAEIVKFFSIKESV